MKKTLTALAAAMIAASSCAVTVCAGKTTGSPNLLPENVERMIAQALETEDFIYNSPYSYSDERSNYTVTVLTPTEVYSLRTVLQDDVQHVWLKRVEDFTLEVDSKRGISAEIQALAGDIALCDSVTDPELPRPDSTGLLYLDTTSSVRSDENGELYSYSYMLATGYSHATALEKAAWGWDACQTLTDMDGVQFMIWSGSVNPGEEIGSYALEPMFGDTDGDHRISIQDAQTVLRAAADLRLGLTPALSDERIALTDVDGDGTLTVKDAQYILMYYANTRVGVDCSWRTLTGNPDAPA